MHIEEYLEKTCTIAPSLNCIVFNKYGEDVFNLSHGLSNVENKSRVNIETCYGIGSVTKIFTALGVLKLAESNDIKIANYVSDYLSDEKFKLNAQQNYPNDAPESCTENLNYLFEHLKHFRVLTATQILPCGAASINQKIRECWLAETEVKDLYTGHYPGEPVMVTENNYKLQLFN